MKSDITPDWFLADIRLKSISDQDSLDIKFGHQKVAGPVNTF